MATKHETLPKAKLGDERHCAKSPGQSIKPFSGTEESMHSNNVQITVTELGDGILTWSRKDSGDDFVPTTVQCREQSTTDTTVEGRARRLGDMARKAPVQEDHFKDRPHRQPEYKIKLPDKERQPSAHKWKGSPSCFKCRLYIRCLVISSALILTLLLYAGLLGAMYGGFSRSVPHPTLLAMAGDTIDCDKLSSSFKKFLSEISFIQEATDKVNDNPNGLSMKVKSFKRTDILSKRQVLNYSGTTDITLNKKYNNILIPDVYYSYPPYIWEGSNISVQVNLSDCTTPPKQLTMYLIYGDLNYNWLEENPSSTPRYEQKFNLLGWDSRTYRMTVRESGYYYIVVRIDPDDSIHLSAYVNFKFYSVSNLSLSDAHKLSSVRDKLTLPLDFHNEEIVVCAVDSQTDLSAYTIHLHLNYSVRGAMAYTIPLIILFVPLVIALLFGKNKLAFCSSRHRHYIRLPETPQNIMNS